jgi:hypothetical protein
MLQIGFVHAAGMGGKQAVEHGGTLFAAAVYDISTGLWRAMFAANIGGNKREGL